MARPLRITFPGAFYHVTMDHELADSFNLTVLELFVRLARNTHRVYLNSNQSEAVAGQLSNWSKTHSHSTGTYITGLED